MAKKDPDFFRLRGKWGQRSGRAGSHPWQGRRALAALQGSALPIEGDPELFLLLLFLWIVLPLNPDFQTGTGEPEHE